MESGLCSGKRNDLPVLCIPGKGSRTDWKDQCMKQERTTWIDWMGLTVFLLISAAGAAEVLGYLLPGSLEATVTMGIIEVLMLLFAGAAWHGRMPFLLLPVAVFACVLGYTTNYAETTSYNWGFWIQGSVAAIACIGLTAAQIIRKEKPRKMPWAALTAAVILAAASLLTWYGFTRQDKHAEGLARHTMWAVPSQFDAVECAQAGTVEELVYMTKAYGTDGRDVQKRALVYLPYGYDSTKEYNILYLMHGTGDDENYWLKTHAYNKTMVDQLISTGNIKPLIIVTPTFYVEDDLKDTGLDPLTYSFREELRNDLMPLVESRYATYAESVDDAGFISSRDHRAFAGLSRGAVTTYHSAFCGSLDWFSWFGTFSGSRTDAEYFKNTIQSEAFRDYPIHYLYVTSGTFDFALPRQLQDNTALLSIEPRLTTGVNTDMDVFPMRYHSIGNWHLALYNFLQRVF